MRASRFERRNSKRPRGVYFAKYNSKFNFFLSCKLHLTLRSPLEKLPSRVYLSSRVRKRSDAGDPPLMPLIARIIVIIGGILSVCADDKSGRVPAVRYKEHTGDRETTPRKIPTAINYIRGTCHSYRGERRASARARACTPLHQMALSLHLPHGLCILPSFVTPEFIALLRLLFFYFCLKGSEGERAGWGGEYYIYSRNFGESARTETPKPSI